MKLRKSNMAENEKEFLEKTMLYILEELKKEFTDIEHQASLLIHLATAINSTVLNWCHREDRHHLLSQIANDTSKHLIEVKYILDANGL